MSGSREPLPRLALLLGLACALGCAPEPDRAQAPDPAAPRSTVSETEPGAEPGAAPQSPPLPAETQRAGTICPDPERACPGFRAHDLSFVLPRDEVARDEARSDTFFAVVLRSAPRCAIREAELRALQGRFPGRKVFVDRAECDGDSENNVRYGGVNPDVSFAAVYAGRDRPEADSLLRWITASSEYPGANLRRMQAIYLYP